MSVVNGRRVIGASLVLIFIWLIPAVAQASVTSVAISAPVNITAGSSSPLCVLAQDNGVPGGRHKRDCQPRRPGLGHTGHSCN